MANNNQIKPLMPKATAVWLLRNTVLTFKQIADSCGLHVLELQTLDAGHLQGENPLLNGQLTEEEIERCAKDEAALLTFQNPVAFILPKKKERKYTPRAFRQDRPNAIAWLLKNHPDLTVSQIARLIATTTKTIQAVRDRTHPNTSQIKPCNPVLLGLCTESQLQDAQRVADKKKPPTQEPETPEQVVHEPASLPKAEPGKKEPEDELEKVFGVKAPEAPKEEPTEVFGIKVPEEPKV